MRAKQCKLSRLMSTYSTVLLFLLVIGFIVCGLPFDTLHLHSISIHSIHNFSVRISKMSSSSTETTTSPTTSPATTPTLAHGDRQCGICKWFDKSKGFGFVQGLTDNHDYFTHHTQLSRPPTSSDYTPSVAFTAPSTAPVFEENAFRFLMAGEYVEFTVDHGNDSSSTKESTKTTLTDTPDKAIPEASEKEASEKRVLAVCVTGIQGGPLLFQSQLNQPPSRETHHYNAFEPHPSTFAGPSYGGGSHGSRRPYRGTPYSSRASSLLDHHSRHYHRNHHSEGFTTVNHRRTGYGAGRSQRGGSESHLARRTRHPHAATYTTAPVSTTTTDAAVQNTSPQTSRHSATTSKAVDTEANPTLSNEYSVLDDAQSQEEQEEQENADTTVNTEE